MSAADSGSSARWVVFLALVLLAPGIFLASGDWQARLALKGDAGDVKNAIVTSHPDEPLSPQELAEVFVDAEQSPSIYKITAGGAAGQVIALEFSTTEGSRIFAGTRTYACYEYRLSFGSEVAVEMSRLKPRVGGGRACTDIRPVPLGFGEPLSVG